MTESRPNSVAELQARLQAERAGRPFLIFADESGAQLIHTLEGERPLLTIGRDESCDIALPWDTSVSRTHAVLERLGDAWTLADDGISRNGTFLNGARLTSRQRLAEGDVIRAGATVITFRRPEESAAASTRLDHSVVAAQITPMQRKVLVELCRPFKDGGRYAAPATNVEIAAELVLSVDAVKTHMRGLFERFEVGDLPQNQKRAKVVELALERGIVSPREL
jgi:pSer/pThr/pTyr-binding forkhead associated (FHA) protein